MMTIVIVNVRDSSSAGSMSEAIYGESGQNGRNHRK
jgi:hypothetical protein